MKSSSGYEIYHNTLSSCLDEIEDYVKSKGYQFGDYFPLVNHISYGQTERTQLEMIKDGKVANTLAIQIYRMDSGRYELNCYPVRKFSGGGGVDDPEIKVGQVYLNTSSNTEIIISKIENNATFGEMVEYHTNNEEPRYYNTTHDRLSLIENLIDNGTFVLVKNKYSGGGGVKSYYIVTFGFNGEEGEYEVHDSKPILAENEQEAGILLRDDFWAYEGIKPDIMTITKAYKTGGYTRPAYDLKTTGDYLFQTNRGMFLVTSFLFERQNDTEDALEIQDNLRGEIGSIIIKNSAWKRLSSGKPVKARSSKGGLFGTLRRAKGVILPEKKFSGGGSTDEGIDLFEDYENVPPQVMAILNKYAEGIEDGDYNAMGDAQNELEEIGYTFDYYVDGSAFDLRPIGTKGKTQDYATGGGVKVLKIGDQYLYKFDNKVYEIIGIGERQVALAPLPITSYWNNWIVTKTLMDKWVKNKMMIKQK